MEFMEKLGELLRSKNVKLHLDGSRILTVAEATGIDVKLLVKECDSINFCFSKVGLEIQSVNTVILFYLF